MIVFTSKLFAKERTLVGRRQSNIDGQLKKVDIKSVKCLTTISLSIEKIFGILRDAKIKSFQLESKSPFDLQGSSRKNTFAFPGEKEISAD
jgi:hypothetical protein